MSETLRELAGNGFLSWMRVANRLSKLPGMLFQSRFPLSKFCPYNAILDILGWADGRAQSLVPEVWSEC